MDSESLRTEYVSGFRRTKLSVEASLRSEGFFMYSDSCAQVGQNAEVGQFSRIVILSALKRYSLEQPTWPTRSCCGHDAC